MGKRLVFPLTTVSNSCIVKQYGYEVHFFSFWVTITIIGLSLL